MSRALIEVEGLSGGYAPGQAAIRELEFTARAGELIAVLGPNGGGKTTLFRALLGELPQIDGRIELGGRIAYVPQTERSRLDFPVNALDVVLMGTYSGLPWYRRVGASQRRASEEALRRVAMLDRATASYGALSGGQRQRVLIARALVQEAPIMLLDEPLSGLDRPSSERVMAILEELREDGCAVLVATHDIHQADDFDAVLCVHGHQVAFGPPHSTLSSEVLERTYGGELVVLEGGERAVVIQHHDH